ncbi:MAG: fused MFS/spermidine synthase [Planctomycetota bacterium]|nr:fused MFS/spermidine synthase [Planctomycetota bacterium]
MHALQGGAVAALAGFAVMSLELAAVRLFAPQFGDSAYVWTNVIGVMLVALAAGAWLGGRLASGGDSAKRLGVALLASGVLTAAVPLSAPAIGGMLLPADLPLDRATEVLVRGSLAATLLAFAPPVLLAGAATPLLVTGLVHSGLGVGRASGLVATWGTLGSLVGTFATTHGLIPGLGSRATVWICAALLILAALLLRWRAGRAALLLIPLAASFLTDGPLRDPAPGTGLLAEVESAYQYLQVVRREGADGAPGAVELKINEGLDSFHSVRVDGTPWTGGRYYDWHPALDLGLGLPEADRPLRVLSLGAAAGTFERVYRQAFPDCQIDSVELDPAVTALGRAFFGAFDGAGEVHAGVDARVFIDRATGSWDVVLVDAYERQVYVPAHVASVEFFRAVAARLAPGGIVQVNAGGRNFDDPVVEVLGATMAEVFGAASAFRIPASRNFCLVARAEGEVGPSDLAAEPAAEADAEVAVMLAELMRPASWRSFRRGGAAVLTDDRPFLDRVQDVALARSLDRSELTRCVGDRDPEALADALYIASASGASEQVMAIAQTARSPSAYLRFAVGDARWRLHDVAGALLEYEDAVRIGADPSLQGALDARIGMARSEIEAASAARSAGRRNGMMAALAGVGVGLFGFGALRVGRRI